MVSKTSNSQAQVLCLGSSLVKATLGYDWISSINKTLPSNIRLINEGIDGCHVPGVTDALPDIAKRIPNPSAIILMAGGNDFTHSLLLQAKKEGRTDGVHPKTWDIFQNHRRGRPPPTLEQFLVDYKELLDRVVGVYPECKNVAVCGLKPVGEDRNGPLNVQIREYNSKLRDIVKENSSKLNISYLEFFEPIATEISDKALLDSEKNGAKIKKSNDILDIFNPSKMVSAKFANLFSFGFYSLDAAGKADGYFSTCDGSHYNESSGKIVVKIIKDHLETSLNK